MQIIKNNDLKEVKIYENIILEDIDQMLMKNFYTVYLIY